MTHVLKAAMMLASCTAVAGTPAGQMARDFANPPKEFTSAPFWVWNDLLSADDVTFTLDTLLGQHIKQPIVHPRPGLMTPYLMDDWFARWNDAMAFADDHGMMLWIYDENSYPSGFAGGHVPDQMPESRGLGMKVKLEKNVQPGDPAIWAIYRKTADGYVSVREALLATPPATDEELLVARIIEAGASPWFGGKTYVDLLHPGVTQKFLELTLDPYKERFGASFGKIIPGVFTDEPHLRPAGGDFHWTPDYPQVFEQRWGRSFAQELPYIHDDSPEGRRFAHNYLYTLNNLYIERWAKPYYAYCENAGLEFTGHYWEHEWPNCTSIPDNMAMAAWQHRPGIDILFDQYSEGPHAQVGNVRAVLELASAANQMGRPRTLCETYGGSGWNMRFEDLKRIGDWVAVLGVNTINEHLSHISLRGARKRDYPPSFSYQSPWFTQYHMLVDYFARVSYALTRGEQINSILVLEPTTTAWMYQFANHEHLNQIGDAFQKTITDLAKGQVEFDLGSEATIETFGSVTTTPDGLPAFQIGKRQYTAVVIPGQMESINQRTFELLHDFLAASGTVFACTAPGLVDGQSSPLPGELTTFATWNPMEESALTGALLARQDLLISADASKGAIVYHHRRKTDDGDVVFLTNTSPDIAAQGVLDGPGQGILVASAETGALGQYPCSVANNRVHATFDLPPSGSLLLFLAKEPVADMSPAPAPRQATPVAIAPITTARLDENVLILDYVDIAVKGEQEADTYWKHAAGFAYAKNGVPGNPWDHAIQFRDEILKTTYPADSGFTAAYHFIIEGPVPASLFAVVERADLYTVTCNGQPVTPAPGAWWTDRSFQKMDIAKIAQEGANMLTITASPLTVFHELEAAYITGDFSLKPVEKGFAIIPSQPLGLGAWTGQGMPLYGGKVSYKTQVETADAAGYALTLPRWLGSVAQVLVNGTDVGGIYRQPYDLDLSTHLKPGSNTVEVIVFGTLRNTLGPHHGEQEVGIMHPGSWNNAPKTGQPAGASYFNLGYGLLEPFVISRLEP